MKLLEAKLAATEARLRTLENIQSFVPSRPVPPPGVAPQPPQNAWLPLERPGPPPAPATPAPDFERMIGANWLSKLGMVVLILGVAFFLRYAIEQGWITIAARVVLGVLGGIAIFTTGDLLRWWDRQRFGVYAQVLAGGGAVITFFSLFAAYQFPEYRAATGMALELDAILLALTAAGLGVYAAVRNAPVLAMEAVALGTLASLFGADFTGFSVVYTVILASATVAAATWRRWPVVLATAVFASFVNLLILQLQDVDPWQLLYGTLGLLALFTIAPMTGRRIEEEPLEGIWGFVTAGSWGAAWGLLLFSLHRIDRGVDTWDGIITGLIALGALSLAVLARETHVNARWGWALAFVAASLVWPFLQFEDAWQAFGRAAIVAAGVAVLVWRDHNVTRAFVVISGIALVSRLATVETGQIYNGELNELDALPSYLIGFAALLAGWFASGRQGTREEPFARGMLAMALVIPIFYGFGALEGFAVPIAWTVEAVLLVVIGFMFSLRDLRLAALAIFGLVLVRLFLVDLLELDLAVRIITFLAVGGLLLVASFLFARRKRGVDVVPAP